jgi:sugar O-acyltransferase (sialic acid O-acetyltransferase NeuD family)
MKNIVIVGSGGHAKVVIDVVHKEGKYRILGLLDSTREYGHTTAGYKIIGSEGDLPSIMDSNQLEGVLIAVGDNFVRSRISLRLRAAVPHIKFVATIHPRACIAEDVRIGFGTVVMGGATINSNTDIGNFCIINTNSSVDHDNLFGDFASAAPGSNLGGNCKIGRFSAIGIGATLLQRIEIGEHTIIGAGSVVTRSIPSHTVAFGVPAKPIRTRSAGEQHI